MSCSHLCILPSRSFHPGCLHPTGTSSAVSAFPPKRQLSQTALLPVACSANKLQVPSQQAGTLVLQRLLAGCRLAVQTLPAAHTAAAQLLGQLSMTYFMPFCLTALAMVSRVQV